MRGRIVILEALLKLRQFCRHLRLFKLSARGPSNAGSAKLDRLTEMLDALLDEGRRILVLSPFTSRY